MPYLTVGNFFIPVVFRRAQGDHVSVALHERQDTDPAAPVNPHHQLVVRIPGRQERPLRGIQRSQVLIHRTREERIDQCIDILNGAEYCRLIDMVSPVPRLDAGLRQGVPPIDKPGCFIELADPC